MSKTTSCLQPTYHFIQIYSPLVFTIGKTVSIYSEFSLFHTWCTERFQTLSTDSRKLLQQLNDNYK